MDGVEALFSSTPFSIGDGPANTLISVGIPTATAFAEANETLWRNLIGLGIVAGVALLAGWFGGTMLVVRPVRRLMAGTRRVGSGDLSARIGPIAGATELRVLGRLFDRMAGALEKRASEQAALEESRRVAERRVVRLVEASPFAILT